MMRSKGLSRDKVKAKDLQADAMLIMMSIIHVRQSKFITIQINEYLTERVMKCIQILSKLDGEKSILEIFLQHGRKVFGRMPTVQERKGLQRRRQRVRRRP
jgi:vesicle coat complex subunit